MDNIIENHKLLEKLDLVKLKKAKHLKAPYPEKVYSENTYEIKLKVTEDFNTLSLHKILQERKSVRNYTENEMPFSKLSNILYYSYGIKGFRSNAYNIKEYPISFSPSAGGLQPFNIYIFISNVQGIQKGLYYYSPIKNSLLQLYCGSPELNLAECYISEFPIYAPVNLILVGDISRFSWKYGYRGYRLMNVDCGILSENISLLATSQKLGSCMLAAFSNEKVSEVLKLTESELPLLCISIGEPNGK